MEPLFFIPVYYVDRNISNCFKEEQIIFFDVNKILQHLVCFLVFFSVFFPVFSGFRNTGKRNSYFFHFFFFVSKFSVVFSLVPSMQLDHPWNKFWWEREDSAHVHAYYIDITNVAIRSWFCMLIHRGWGGTQCPGGWNSREWIKHAFFIWQSERLASGNG